MDVMIAGIGCWLGATGRRVGAVAMSIMLIAFAAAGCASTAEAGGASTVAGGSTMADSAGTEQGEGLLVGRLIDGHYTTPLGKFRAKLPELDPATAMVRDLYRDGLFGLMIWDGEGRLYRVDGQRLTAEQQELLGELEPEQRYQVLADSAIQPYLAFSPDAQLVETVPAESHMPGAVLIVVRVPGGEVTMGDAVSADEDTAEPIGDEQVIRESHRAVVVFRYVHGLYSASTVGLPDESIEAMKERALGFADGLYFAGMDRAK